MFPTTRFKEVPCPNGSACIYAAFPGLCLFTHKSQSASSAPSTRVPSKRPAPSRAEGDRSSRNVDPPTKRAARSDASMSISLTKEVPSQPISHPRPSLTPATEKTSTAKHDAKQPGTRVIKDIVPKVDHSRLTAQASSGPRSLVAAQRFQVPMNMHFKVPHASRQKIAEKFLEQFQRIYQPISTKLPQLAQEHALKQELECLSKCPNTSKAKDIYITYAGGILSRLKKRPAASSETDIGTDGEYDPKKKQAKSWNIAAVNAIVLSTEDMKQHGYPLFPEDNETENSTETLGQPNSRVQKCERCGIDFDTSDARQAQSCQYHTGRIQTERTHGSRERVYSCCSMPSSSAGCSTGHHVYKLEGFRDLDAYIPFRSIGNDTQTQHQLVALDCEMSYTEAGMELTRLTVVDKDGKVLVDELCKTQFPVVDLNTRFSGIKSLNDAKYNLGQLHELLEGFIGKDTIIIGHGLENDLNALRLVHTKVVDTSVLFRHRDPQRKYSLRYLSDKLLGQVIQNGVGGHDSYEDARACLELVHMFLDKGESAFALL